MKRRAFITAWRRRRVAACGARATARQGLAHRRAHATAKLLGIEVARQLCRYPTGNLGAEPDQGLTRTDSTFRRSET
jgi:hypothetical protein